MRSQAWIEMIPETEATGELAELYARHEDPRHGVVDNILKIHSLKPRTLRDHGNLYRTTMYGPSELSRIEREMIAVVVSSLNDCHY
jgi:alkylhydroperoxidase family enzyme